MVIRTTLPDGTFLTLTTRKGNYSFTYWGKSTVWASEQAYRKGDCEGAVTTTGIFIGTSPDELPRDVDTVVRNFKLNHPKGE